MRFAVCFMCVISLLLLSMPAFADGEARYVKENFRISVRNGASDQSTAIGTLTAGDKVTVTKTSNGWSYVQSPQIEGWVSTALLVNSPPAVTILNETKAQNEILKEENITFARELERLRSENANLKQILDSSNSEAQACLVLMEKTGNDLTSLVNIKEDYDKLQQELAAKTKKLDSLEKSVPSSVFYNYLRWFISGAAVLVIGFLIGVITKRSNNRRYY